MMKEGHTPVLTQEMVEFLKPRSDGVYLDVTLGGGGWSRAILEESVPEGRVIAFDRDELALSTSLKTLEKFSGRFQMMKAKFSEVAKKLEEKGITSIDGVVADLGVSSPQLDIGERGFSFSKPSRLDMRMDQSQKKTAYDVVNSASADELEKYFFEFGEERYARRIVRAVVDFRKKRPIETTTELAALIAHSVPRSDRIHPATRTFQGLRIVVNDEMEELKVLVDSIPPLLAREGRFIVASYHSLEDRVVKQKFRELKRSEKFHLLTPKPIRPSAEEVRLNPRSRSARLRALEKL